MPKPSVSGAATGALGGAGTGFAIGGPVGAGIGGVVGGLAGLFGGNAGSQKAKTKQLDLLTPQQKELMGLLTQGIKGGGGPFKDLLGDFNPEQFEKGVTQPALKNFQENILPTLQEKFVSGSGVRGSSFRNAQLKAGTDLQSQLSALMYQAQQQQKQNKLAGLQSALGVRGFENVQQGASPGFGTGLAQGLIPEISKVAGSGLQGMFSGSGSPQQQQIVSSMSTPQGAYSHVVG